MRILFPILFAVIVIIIFGVLQLLFFKFLNQAWWQKDWIRRASWGLPLTGIVSVVMWGYGEYTTRDWLAYPGAIVSVLMFILEVSLFLSLPLSGVIHFIDQALDRISKKHRVSQSHPVDRHRRLLLRAGAAAIPMVALSGAAGGVARAMGPVDVFKKVIEIDGLLPELNGLKILHLSDIHLRHYVTLEDLSRVLQEASSFSPHITLVTGDIADDLRVLDDALKLISDLNPALGTYACLGNHEYYRGVDDVLRSFDRTAVPLLVNLGVTVKTGSTSIFIGGLDDPRFMTGEDEEFFRMALKETLGSRGEADFGVLMSHRPGALDYASETGINLILAGHTHGGQIGINNRSLFESMWPEKYLWGHYEVGGCHLYTSSGVGHWFPYRLGCPAEAPIIELRQTRNSL